MTHEQKIDSMNGVKKVIKPAQNPVGSSIDMGIKGLCIQFVTKRNVHHILTNNSYMIGSIDGTVFNNFPKIESGR